MSTESKRVVPAPAAQHRDWAECLTRLLDDAVTIPGTRIRFGLDAILGALLPGAGDTLTALGSVSLLLLALKRRVPTPVLLSMLVNIAIDAGVGALPILGDLFDVGFKANRRNLELIRRFEAEGARSSLADYAIVGVALLFVGLAVLLPILVWSMLLGPWLAANT